VILVGGELYFRFFFAETDGLPTLAQQNWMARYWQTNSLGYRDREWTSDDWVQRTTILAVGDSFTAGYGLEDTSKRFADVLAQQLNDNHIVINLGKPGASTVDELANLEGHPLQTPDIVILQYTLNDIETAALSIGLNPGLNPLANVPAWANESHLANFLYWRLVPALNPQARGFDSYIAWLHSMYDHSVVWDIHEQQINAFIDAVEGRGAQLIVVIFPDMNNPFGSILYVDRVAHAFEQRGYGEQVIRLFDAAEAMPLQQRVVSPRDAHPSSAFHALVGAMIYDRYFATEQAAR
jgi:lysophospholipase L1-like esterase